MAFIGSREGPRKSLIIARLGWEYFGITPEQLERDIIDAEADETAGLIDQPLTEKETGRRYLLFNAPGGGIQRFYLEEAGCRLPSDTTQEPKE